ncbi:MAG: MMPL family transporter [Gammaproteobacteria bacterium]
MLERLEHLITRTAVTHPRTVIAALAALVVAILAAAVLPTVWPQSFPGLNGLKVDTDPENMLPYDEPARVFHRQAQADFAIHDIVAVGIVNDTHPDGVFNPASLERIYRLTEFARTLEYPDPEQPGRTQRVVTVDVVAPSTVDDIRQAGAGAVSFSWLMPAPPQTLAEAHAVRDRALRLPFLVDALVSGDGKAITLALPVSSKKIAFHVREDLLAATAAWSGTGDEVHITGVPVAEETFSVEMFVQMGVASPLCMLLLFVLLWWFFKRLVLVVSPMIVAMACAMGTMGLMVVFGYPIHIMTSMIPIFVMPVSVLDAVHVLSEFFDRYPQHRDRRRTIEAVMRELFKPMLFTTLTTMVGFASLALAPIPPIQVFGLFVAAGVFLAWLWTVLFIPAYIMLVPEARLEGYGHHAGDSEDVGLMSRTLRGLGMWTQRRARAVVVAIGVAAVVAAWGISHIEVNDNPVKWFTASHPIRIAENVLNEHFGGTYLAYLHLAPAADEQSVAEASTRLVGALERERVLALGEGVAAVDDVFDAMLDEAGRASKEHTNAVAMLDALADWAVSRTDAAPAAAYEAWERAALVVDRARQYREVFKRPEVLRYIAGLQAHLVAGGYAGKTTSLADLVATVHRELMLGDDAAFRIPDTPAAVGQTLLTFENSHRPQDLWHFVSPDYRRSVVWLQLESGDNRDMQAAVDAVETYVARHPPPTELVTDWFGLTYINVVWQDRMVSGMLTALGGSYVVVLVMMALLLRSLWWGLLSMLPLTMTVALIYGIVGISGKDYDMPVAVLSSLSIGLAIDYAIHFLVRARAAVARTGSWAASVPELFGETARAITRNAIVLGVGFTPLLAAPLVPYKTVGVFIASILLIAGLVSLIVLPAVLRLGTPLFFPQETRS